MLATALEAIDDTVLLTKSLLSELLPELLGDLTGAAAAHAMPARLAACFGPPQPSNPICYVGAGGQATPLHFDRTRTCCASSRAPST